MVYRGAQRRICLKIGRKYSTVIKLPEMSFRRDFHLNRKCLINTCATSPSDILEILFIKFWDYLCWSSLEIIEQKEINAIPTLLAFVSNSNRGIVLCF